MSNIDYLYEAFNDKPLSMASDGERLIFTYRESDGTITDAVVSRDEYNKKAQIAGYKNKLSSIYIEGKLNCFIENDILYLDQSLPFSTQIKQIIRESEIFSIDYKRIHYEGKMNFFDRFTYRYIIDDSKKNNSEDTKINNVFADIKLKYTRLHSCLKDYIDQRIKEIYATPEERFANIDITKPIERVEQYSIYDQLVMLDNQMSMFFEVTSFLNSWEKNEQSSSIDIVIEQLSGPYKNHFTNLVDKEKRKYIDLLIKNAIAESEGKEFIPREKIARDFDIKIKKYSQLVRDYCLNNGTAIDLIAAPNIDCELIIARIESVFSFYNDANPYEEKIEEFKGKIRNSISNQEEHNRILEEYKQYLIKALKATEEYATQKAINSWKTHQDGIIYGLSPILVQINSTIVLYHQSIEEVADYELKKEYGSDRRIHDYQKLEAIQRVSALYENEYQNIIKGLARDAHKSTENSMVKPSEDREYEVVLGKLTELIKRIRSEMRRAKLNDGIENLRKKYPYMKNTVEDDPQFTAIFEAAKLYKERLISLENYSSDKSIFNHEELEKQADSAKQAYNEIVQRIKEYYDNVPNENELKSILEALDNLVKQISIIIENEEKILGEIKRIKNQQRRF